MTVDNKAVSREEPVITASRSPLRRAAGTGAMYLGPGDVYRFLVTGAHTAGAYFAMEAIVAPGGGPPPHIHRHEDETFYVVEGECGILLGEEWITADVGDFVNVPRGTVHRFENQGTEAMRMILTFTPAGIEKFFEETLQRTLDPTADIPDNVDAIAARYAAAAPRYGMGLFVDGDPRAEITRAVMSRRQPAHID
jgi:quercetin dioxygenase-like cupin family protein